GPGPQVVPVVPAGVGDLGGAVEAQVGQGPGDPGRAGLAAQVVDAKAHAGLFQEVADLVGVPGGVAELQNVAEGGGEPGQEAAQPPGVAAPVGRQLVQGRPLVRAQEAGPAEDVFQRPGRVLEFLEVGEEPARLDRVDEPGGCLPPPAGEGLGGGQAVKAVVDL